MRRRRRIRTATELGICNEHTSKHEGDVCRDILHPIGGNAAIDHMISKQNSIQQINRIGSTCESRGWNRVCMGEGVGVRWCRCKMV